MSDRPVRAEIDGIPTFSSEVPEDTAAGELTAALVFRVGTADETLVAHGITHVVEHLTLAKGGQRSYACNASVDMVRTAFFARGTPEEVGRFLSEVVAGLAEPPLDRLDAEARVLRTEAAGRPTAASARLLAYRCGPFAHGLGAYPEYALHWLDPAAVEAWARDRFTAANAAIWATGPLPADLRLPLPPGRRVPAPRLREAVPIERASVIDAPDASTCVSLVTRRTAAVTTALTILVRRVERSLRHERGVSYATGAAYEPIDGDTAIATVVSDVAEGRGGDASAALASVCDDLADRGPSVDELAEAVGVWAREPSAEEVRAHLASCVVAELDGTEAPSLRELAAERGALTPAVVQGAFADALGRGLISGPDAADRIGDRWRALPSWSADTIRGRRSVPTRDGAQRLGPGARLVFGHDGVSLLYDRKRRVTVHFADCAAMVWWTNGRRVLIGADGSLIDVYADDWRKGRDAVALMDSRISPDRCVPGVPMPFPFSAPSFARVRPRRSI